MYKGMLVQFMQLYVAIEPIQTKRSHYVHTYIYIRIPELHECTHVL